MKKTMLLCVIIFSIGIGCGPRYVPAPHVPQPYTYKVFIPSETNESKMCRRDCQKVLLMQRQSDELEYQSDVIKMGRYTAGLMDMRAINRASHEREYKKCEQDCGGTFETREGMR